jgi:monoamine oxidase
MDLGLSIAWHHVPYQLGGWADWDKIPVVHYETLLEPDGQVIVAGDQVSYLPGWQEGAMLSARYVLQRITRGSRLKVAAAATTKRHAPDTRALTEGSGPTRKHN